MVSGKARLFLELLGKIAILICRFAAEKLVVSGKVRDQITKKSKTLTGLPILI